MRSTSIIIPAHNEAKHLPNLLDSIGRTIDYGVEVIIVDNGSSDHTADIAKQFSCRVVQTNKKYFPSVARNIGANSCNSDLLVFLDADIIVTDSWAKELRRLASDSDFTDFPTITGDSYHMSLHPSWLEKYWFEPLRRRKTNYINGGNIIVCRKTFEEIGGFNQILETGEDVDFCERARRHGIRIIFNPLLIVHHEGFPQNLKHFFRREKWHGKGDFSSFQYFKKSRVAHISVLIGCCYTAILLLIPLAIYQDSSTITGLLSTGILTIFILCAIASFMKFKGLGPMYSTIGTFVYFIYFNARLASLFSLWRGRDKAASASSSKTASNASFPRSAIVKIKG
jgi:glycosyltransferase involved in cell wall biosynthesis